MADLIYFTVTAHFLPLVADSSSDSDYNPDIGVITAKCNFTPLIQSGDVLKATTDTPPTSYLPFSVDTILDTDGYLKLRATPDSGGSGTYAPVRLLGNSPALNLASPLYYSFSFSEIRIDGKLSEMNIAGGSFEAPSSDTTVDLIYHLRETGSTAQAAPRLAPGGVRVDGENLVFTFDSVDIADPIPLSIFKGDTGDAATIAVGTVTTVAPGEDATVTNSGSSGSAVFDFEIPGGDKGDKGDTGDAATIEVGTVSTGNAGSSVSVNNSGSSSSAVLDFTIPRGNTGAAATVAVGTVTTGAAGSSATVTNSGSSSAAVLDFAIPRGDTGAAGGAGGAGEPTITAGTTAQYWRGDKTWQTLNQDAVPSGTTNKAYTATEQTKLAGVATGATANSTDAVLLNRANHTGTMGIAGISATGTASSTTFLRGDGTWSAVSGSGEPVIATGTTAQYWRGDKTWQTLNQDAVPSGTTNKVYTATEQTKLAGIATAATANSADATLLARANHTGTQLAATISDFSTAADARVVAGITGKEATITAGLTTQFWRGDKTWQVLNQDVVPSGTTNKAYTATEQTKLAGIATAATANSADATLLARANHTGTQLAATISDFATAADARVVAGITGKEATITAGTTAQFWRGDKSWQTLNQDAVPSGTTNKAYTATEQTKLAGIAAAATANSADATLLSRANHTGTQLAATISDFSTAADARVVAGITGKQDAATAATLTGAQTLTNKTLTSPTVNTPTINGYTEGVVAVGTVTTTSTLAITSGTVLTATLTASTACTFTMPAVGAGKSFTLMLKQAAATGNGSATFTSVKWNGSGAPTITATAGKMDILSFFSDGTNWYGSYAQGYTP